MLDCCVTLDDIKKRGITLSELICLATCEGVDIQSFRSDKGTLEEFRQCVKRVTLQDESCLVASYSRKVLGQTGSGHFSPLAGYHPEKDLVLILDTARFKYGCHWAPVELVWDAMNTKDDLTNESRGYVILSKKATLEVRDPS